MEMNIIQVADPQGFYPFPASPFVAEGAGTDTRLEDWVRRHHEAWAAADIFVIDAQFSFFGRETAPFGGIRLLKLLRLSGFRQHCILYSFLSLQKILTVSRHNTILLSCGTTYVQLPDPVDEELCQAKAKIPCEEDMLPFFQAEALEYLGTKRHSLANWWGLVRMYEVLNACGLIGDDVPRELKDTLRRDSSYEGQLMNFVRFKERQPQFTVDPERTRLLLSRMRALWKKNLKVVYVDDCADDGWAYLLQLVLYGQVNPDLFIVPEIPREGIDPAALAQEIILERPDLVLLDIRLVPEDEQAAPFALSGVLLTKALVEASNTCPILILTASDKRAVSESAFEAGADGVWTKEGIDEGRNLSADKYGTFSLGRIEELVMQMRRLSGFEFTLLYDGLKHINELESSEDVHWWEKDKWFPADTQERTALERSVLIGELKKLFVSHKQFMAATQPAVRTSAYDMLTIKLCRILEILHPTGFGNQTEVQTLGKVIVDTWPPFSVAATYAQHLIATRNEVVHFDSKFDFARNDALRYKNTMDAFFAYLTLPNPSERPGWAEGEIRRQTDDDGQVSYLFRGGSFVGRFASQQDIRACEHLLDGRESVSHVKAALSQPTVDFNLGEVRMLENYEQDRMEYWTAAFSVLQTTGGWNVDLSLFNIVPRKDLNFRIRTANVGIQVTVGDRLYFFPKWKDLPEGRPTCSLYNVQLAPPRRMKHTYWSGCVTKVHQADSGTFVRLTNITPPFNARFKAVTEFLTESTDINALSRICFRPDIAQEWIPRHPSPAQRKEREERTED